MSQPEQTTPTANSPATTEPKLQVDFSWRKFKALVSDSVTGKDIYIIDTNFTSPDLEFFYAADDSSSSSSSTSSKMIKGASFATGNIHTFKIDAECKVHGQEIKLKPFKRFATHYTHLSPAYATTGSVDPVVLEWTTTSTLKNWDFICVNQKTQEPLVRLSSNIWAVKKLGFIEFMGTPSRVQKEELVVTGVTLFYCMLARSQNILAFFGAIFADAGPIGDEEKKMIEMVRLKEDEQVDTDGKAKVA